MRDPRAGVLGPEPGCIHIVRTVYTSAMVPTLTMSTTARVTVSTPSSPSSPPRPSIRVYHPRLLTIHHTHAPTHRINNVVFFLNAATTVQVTKALACNDELGATNTLSNAVCLGHTWAFV